MKERNVKVATDVLEKHNHSNSLNNSLRPKLFGITRARPR